MKKPIFIGLIFWGVLVCSLWSFENVSYSIKGEFNRNGHKIDTYTQITFSARYPIEEIHLRVYPNHRFSQKEKRLYKKYARYFAIDDPFVSDEDGGFELKSILVNGKDALDFAFVGDDKTTLVIKLAKPQTGTIKVAISSTVVFPNRYGRFGFVNDVYSAYRIYPMLSVYQGGRWLDEPDYILHQPYVSDAAHYDVELYMPKGWQVCHTGALKEVTDIDGRSVWRISTEYPVRDFAFAFSPRYSSISGFADDGRVKITVFYIGGTRKAQARKVLEFAKGAIEYYGKKYGRYPYSTYSIAPVYLGYGGNESSQISLFDTRLFDMPRSLDRYMEFLVVHETGHQWFYNIVGSNEYRQTWLDEGVNSYAEYRYFIDKYGENPEMILLPKALRYFLPNIRLVETGLARYLVLSKRGISMPVLAELANVKDPSLIFSFAYGKGRHILIMLERIFGRETVDKALANYVRENTYKIANVSGFIKMFSDTVGRDLSKWFDFWFSGDTIDVSATSKGIQVHTQGKASLPFDVEVERGAHIIKADPKDTILEVDEANNIWPYYKRFGFDFVPINHSLYDLDVVNPLDQITLRAGGYLSRYGIGSRATLIYPYTWIASASVLRDLDEDATNTILTLEKKALFNRFAAFGIEFMDSDFDDRKDEAHMKAYVRFDIAPPRPAFAGVNDHITFYVAKDSRWYQTASGLTRPANVSMSEYRFADSSYIGIALQKGFDRAKANIFIENAGHFLGSDEYFYKAAGRVDLLLFDDTRLGSLQADIFLGVGAPHNKELFYLGSSDGLKAYRRKAIKGANVVYCGLEYLFPVYKADDSERGNGYLDIKGISLGPIIDYGRVWQALGSAGSSYWDIGLAVDFDIVAAGMLANPTLNASFAYAPDDDASRLYLSVKEKF